MGAKKNRKKKVPVNRLLNNKPLIVIIAVVLIILLALATAEYFYPGSVPFISWVFGQEEADDTGDHQNPGSDTNNPVVPAGLEVIDIPNALTVYFLNVGQGDSILLRFPDGTDFLIDGGNGSSASQAEIADYLGRLSATGLDDIEYLIATHPDSDHINMLDDVLSTYEVNRIYYNGYIGNTVTFEKFDEAAKEETYGEGTPAVRTLFDGDGETYHIDGGSYTVDIYAPGYQRFGSDANAMSPIIIVEYGGRKLVLSGDAEEDTEAWFITATGLTAIDCDIYKVGHHGSRTSSSVAFLDFITCEYAVISCGEDNSYGHPHQETLAKLEARSYLVYRTDQNGTVTAYIDADGDIAFVNEK